MESDDDQKTNIREVGYKRKEHTLNTQTQFEETGK